MLILKKIIIIGLLISHLLIGISSTKIWYIKIIRIFRVISEFLFPTLCVWYQVCCWLRANRVNRTQHGRRPPISFPAIFLASCYISGPSEPGMGGGVEQGSKGDISSPLPLFGRNRIKHVPLINPSTILLQKSTERLSSQLFWGWIPQILVKSKFLNF